MHSDSNVFSRFNGFGDGVGQSVETLPCGYGENPHRAEATVLMRWPVWMKCPTSVILKKTSSKIPLAPLNFSAVPNMTSED
jgi:hypothetical protein